MAGSKVQKFMDGMSIRRTSWPARAPLSSFDINDSIAAISIHKYFHNLHMYVTYSKDPSHVLTTYVIITDL